MTSKLCTGIDNVVLHNFSGSFQLNDISKYSLRNFTYLVICTYLVVLLTVARNYAVFFSFHLDPVLKPLSILCPSSVSVSLSQRPASLEIISCVLGDLSVCWQGTGGIIAWSLHSHTWWSALLPQFEVTYFYGEAGVWWRV